MSAQGTFVLRGKRAALGQLEQEHAPLLAPWFNDPDVRRGLVGVTGLGSVDWAFGRCSFGIFLGRRRGGAVVGGERVDVILMDAVPER